MIDKTDASRLAQLQHTYNGKIADYKYKVWKEAYLAKPPKGAFCIGITRYRKCCKITHIILKDGRKISLGASGCLNSLLLIFSAFLILVLISFYYIF